MDEPEVSIEEFEPSEIVPYRIGFCTNWIDRHHICGREIDDQDIEAVELPQIGKRRQFVCGPCVERLLSKGSSQ